MTPVLHVSREVADALPAGLSIAPVEERVCPCFGVSDDECAECPGAHPPVLSGRIAIAVDGAIIGTATAEEVLPVVAGLTGPRGVDAWLSIVRGGDRFYIRRRGLHGLTDQPVTAAAALNLRPGGWVVAVSDVAPADRCPFGHDKPPAFRAEDIDSDAPLDGTRLAADIAATVPEANREVRRAEWRAELKARTRARRKCRFCMFGELVPVPAAPAGTVTTWEAT